MCLSLISKSEQVRHAKVMDINVPKMSSALSFSLRKTTAMNILAEKKNIVKNRELNILAEKKNIVKNRELSTASKFCNFKRNVSKISSFGNLL